MIRVPIVHIGVVALLAPLLLLAACTTADWGRCLMSHEETHPTNPIVQPDGSIVPSGEYETVTVCDRWEYPNGVRP